MGISGNFSLPPEGHKPEKIAAINRQAIEKEEKRRAAEEARILGMVKRGMTREQAEEVIAREEENILREMINRYPPDNQSKVA